MKLSLKADFPLWVLRFLCAWPAPWIQHCKEILSQRILLNNAQIPGPQNLWNKQFSGSLEQVIHTTCCIWGCRLKKQWLTGVYSQSIETERPSPDTQVHINLWLISCLLTFHWMKQVTWPALSQGVGMYTLSNIGHGKVMDTYSYSKAINY